MSLTKRLLVSAAAFVLFATGLAVAGELLLRAVEPRSDPVRIGVRLPLRSAHEAITQFSATHDLAALDLLPRLAGHEVSELTVFLDGHPNARAHEIFADALFEKLTASAGTPPGR